MKILLLTLLLVSFTYGFETDKWLHNYDKALKVAQKEHKNIYLFIGADKCHFCKMFKEKTLSKAKVMKRLRRDYILIYLSRDRHQIHN